MSTPVTVYVPCDLVTVEAQLGYGDSLSAMEQVVLETVAQGVTGIGELHEVLGLDSRVLHDLVFDLWRARHVHIDHDLGGLRLSGDVQDLVAAGTLDRLDGAEVLRVRMELMIDRLMGRLRPASGPSRRPPRDWDLPLPGGEFGIETVEQADRLKAINDTYALRSREQEQAGRERLPRVRGVRLEPDASRSGGVRWLPLEVAAAVDADGGLNLAVVNHEWPPTERIAANAALRRLAQATPEARVWKRLREAPSGDLAEPPSLSDAITRLGQGAARAATAPAGLRGSRHRELCDDARSVQAGLVDRCAREVEAGIVAAAELRPLVIETIQGARRQVVLAAPTVVYERLQRLLPALRDALIRDVQVVLLWGDRHETTLPENVRNALRELRRAGGTGPAAPLLVPLTSADVGSSMLVADDDRVLFSRGNLLGAGTGRGPGMVIQGPGGRGSVGIRDILRRLRQSVPDYEMSRAVLVGESDFAARPGAGPARAGDRSVPSLPSVSAIGPFPLTPPEDVDPAAEAATRSWSRAWEAWAGAAADVLAGRTAPALSEVVDGGHRDLLMSVLHEAHREVVISSGRVDGRALDERLVAALRAALVRGVQVTVVHGDPAGPDPEPLRRLAAEFGGRLLQAHRPGHRAPALIWDDEAVVTTFDFLSQQGPARYGVQAGTRLGLRLSGGGFAAELAGSLDVAFEEAASAPAGEAAREHTARTDYATYATAQSMVTAALSGNLDTALLLAEFDARPQPWDVLEELADTGADDVIRIAAARCLTAHQAAAPAGAADRWLAWLVRDRWQSGEFVEAALLRHRHPADDLRPHRSLTLVGAARQLPGSAGGAAVAETALTEAALADDLLAAEREAVVAVAVTDLVFRGSTGALEVLQLLDSELTEPWAGLARSACDYWEAAHSVLPLDRIAAEVGELQDRTAADDAWRVLRERLDLASGLTLNNTGSRRAQQSLFHETAGTTAGIRAAAAGRDHAALRAELGRLPDVDRLLEEAAAEAARGGPAIDGRHRKMLRSRLDGVLRAARAAADDGAAADEAAGGARDAVVVAARDLAADLHRTFEALGGAASGDAPELVLARAALAELESVAVWGSSSEEADTP